MITKILQFHYDNTDCCHLTCELEQQQHAESIHDLVTGQGKGAGGKYHHIHSYTMVVPLLCCARVLPNLTLYLFGPQLTWDLIAGHTCFTRSVFLNETVDYYYLSPSFGQIDNNMGLTLEIRDLRNEW